MLSGHARPKPKRTPGDSSKAGSRNVARIRTDDLRTAAAAGVAKRFSARFRVPSR